MKRLLCLLSCSALLLFGFAVSGFSADGAALYQRCISCHAADGTKPPHVLKGQTSAELLTKMQGYASGTYGGQQKALMQKLVQNISPEDMKALADHIATF